MEEKKRMKNDNGWQENIWFEVCGRYSDGSKKCYGNEENVKSVKEIYGKNIN